MIIPKVLESDSEFELVEELPTGKIFQCYHVKDMRKGGADAVVRLLPEKFAADQSIVNRCHEFFARFNDIPNRRYIPSVYSVVGVPGKDVYVVEEYCAGVSLAHFVNSNRKSKTFIRDVTEILARVCEALHHAHQKNISHLCVLPSDILIDDNDYSKVKLVGFGAQIFASKGKIDCLSTESRKFVAPEVFKRGVFGPKADVYSLAVTIKDLLPEFSQGADLLGKARSITLKDRFTSARQFAANLKELALTDPVAESTPKASKPVKPATPKGGLQPILKVTTDPPGATVIVDGQVMGRTTISGFSFPWSPGKTITFEKSGYEIETLNLDTPPENSTIQIKLKSSLTLFTSPWGATVKINAELLGTTTYKGLMIPWDKGDIVIEKQGFKPETLRFASAPTKNETCVELKPHAAFKTHPLPEKPAQSNHVDPQSPSPAVSPQARLAPSASPPKGSQPTLWNRFRSTDLLSGYRVGILISVFVIGLLVLVTNRPSINTPTQLQSQSPQMTSSRKPLTAATSLDMDLIAAAGNGDDSKVRMLLAQGAVLKAQNSNGYTGLMLASFKGHFEVVKTLLKAGADKNLKSRLGWTASDFAKQYDHYNVLSLLSQNAGGQPHTAQTPTITPTKQFNSSLNYELLGASNGGSDQQVKSLLARGADPNFRNPIGVTPLMYAAGNNKSEQVRTLLASGADPSLKDKDGWTAEEYARRRNHYDIVSLLDPSGGGKQPQNPPRTQFNSSLKDELFTACSGGDVQKVRNFLWSGVDPNARSQGWGRTPLIIAIDNNQPQVVKVLLISGADPTLMDRDGRDALYFASQRNNPEILELLRKHK